MTTRTQRSGHSSLGDDQDVYTYALKVAVLSHNITRAGHAARSPGPSTSSPLTSNSTHASSLVRPSVRQSVTGSMRPSEGWTNALTSLGDVFKDSSSSANKSSRFPKDFVKALDQRMERIARGADSAHADPLFRQTVGAFYTTYAQPSFQKKLKENRQIEEVILMFVTTASGILKKRLEGDEWKAQLNAQVGRFVGVIRDTLKTCSRVPSELVNRLDTYCAKLAEAPAPQGHERTASNTSGNSPYYSPHPASSALPPSSPTLGRQSLDISSASSVNLDDMPDARAVGAIFGKSEAELKQDVVRLRRSCSEQAAFNDLKNIINAVAQLSVSSAPAPSSASETSSGSRFPFRRDDFDAEDAFLAWKKQENDELQELLLEITMRNPELVKGGGATLAPDGGAELTSRRSSRSSLVLVGADGSTLDVDDRPGSSADTSNYTFIPPDPRLYYRRLYSLALEHDYALMSTLPPDQDVSLTILSPLNEQLLRDCQTRWRVPNTTRAATFANLIAGLYKDQGVPEECVGEALDLVKREEDKWRYWRWPTADRQQLFKALSLLFDTLLTRFFEIFQGLLGLPFSAVVPLLQQIHEDQLYSSSIGSLLPTTLSELEMGMKKFVAMAFEEKMADADSKERASDLEPWIEMLMWMREEVKGYDRAFPEKLCGQIDPPALFLSVAAPHFVHYLDRSRSTLHAAAAQQNSESTDADLLELYHGVRELKDMHHAFLPDEPLDIDFSAWFEPFVRRWLATTDTQTSEWVNRAISKDKFEPEETATHSSSIVDLIDSCKAPVDFILRLKWPNEYEHAKFLTGLSRTVAKSIEQYANQLEAMFIDEMFPRKPDEALNQDVARPSAWLTKAKMVVQGDKKIEPFEFQPASCIKLNNIQAARRLLDTMYSTLDADRVSRIVEINTPPPPPNAPTSPPRYLFTVKIVLCENLSPPTGNSRTKKLDPFLILSDPAGYRVAKTRTLYETNDPRWDETLDISVKGDLWLRATVYNRNLVDHHDHVGCAYIHLDPRKFSDFLAQDVWYRLEDQSRRPLDSRLLLRISMEGEKDDIQFYFGRAFRSLKRAEGDMVRTMVDKMSPFVRHYISHQNLRSLLKTGAYNLDLEKVRGNLDKGVRNLNAYVRDALAASTSSNTSTLLIPPVEDPNAPTAVTIERLEQRKKGKGPLTDIEIENAIGDLLDYFEVTFATLKESLTPDAWQLVSMRLWKEILTTVEGLLVPPLSDRPTEMRPLSEKEVDVVYKWLGFLVNFFHGGGEGVPLEDLRNAKYLELIEARMYYEWSTDDLMRASVETMQRQLTNRSDSLMARSKSVYQQRNLGTIRARKIEKQQKMTSSGEMILRILRMHPGTTDFLGTQIATMHRMQAEQARKQQLQSQRGSLQRSVGKGGRGAGGERASGMRGGLASIADE
ncbi:hypothetical protein NBRC10513v2_007138 [Rhodotorula toruloides]|uniref:BY PROTMAP: gi/647402457/emb/CDR48713.1/ RHTO0S19e03026g1_1 [Rhodosporidium toruloides] n=1 Tax=Rhodotorula toruloides TaxID=5286 RepID=A0A0K3CTL0_RHOTO